ncbi:hypothetical protein E4U57_002275 [Claviceps arundinis]|uniref:FAD/NAD(P)-binding domain-containing protein n=1 Tax=Claviceps arundinis TaxID=1623583 RepID=A0A9P7MPW9_9HYPO|nr:hypothetical protein E4U57_002275 [Claviceps arundinis]KAG5963862.1 hypothetical protein E4U56_002564 [Claviceps arundinis]
MPTDPMDVTPPTVYSLPGSVNIPLARFPPPSDVGDVNAWHEANAVVERLNNSLSDSTFKPTASLFAKDGYWRDHLMLSWNFRTVQGPVQIANFLQVCAESKDGLRLQRVAIDESPSRRPATAPLDGTGKVVGIQAFLRIETVRGTGDGLIRLAHEDGEWKIFTIYTSLRGLKGYEESTSHNRTRGVSHGGQPGRKNWADRRLLARNFEDGTEPQVLIVGAGQAGLTAAVRLKALGVNSLIIDRNERVGDNWRNRYHQLVLHDPVWYDHMPYLNFPPQWPVFTPKDKLADWFESYVSIMELNVWMRTELVRSSWDETKRTWTIELARKGSDSDGASESRTFHPRHVIQATGHCGVKCLPVIPGMESFAGHRICHSAEFLGARDDEKGMKAVVVGSCNSGLDIAQELFENGYDVTIVQRSSTTVVSSYAITDIAMKGLYSEDGPPVDDADMIMHSMPNSVFKAVQVEVGKVMRENDKDLLKGLENAGFKIDNGPDDSGLFYKYFQRGGGYYIDVGASKLITDGKIKVKQGKEIREILPRGMRLSDGTELEADQIIFATGYQSMRSQTRELFGDAIARRVHDVWGLNEEGEWRTMWQRSGHPGLWYHGGNMALCRYYSQLLALQIKGLEEGLYKYEED